SDVGQKEDQEQPSQGARRRPFLANQVSEEYKREQKPEMGRDLRQQPVIGRFEPVGHNQSGSRGCTVRVTIMASRRGTRRGRGFPSGASAPSLGTAQAKTEARPPRPLPMPG